MFLGFGTLFRIGYLLILFFNNEHLRWEPELGNDQ